MKNQSAIIVGCAMLAFVCTVEGLAQSNIPDDTVVAVLGTNSVRFGDIRMSDKDRADVAQHVSDPVMQATVEYNWVQAKLRRKFEEIVVTNAVARYGPIRQPTEAEITNRAAAAVAETNKRQQELQQPWKELVPMLKKDPAAAEKLYQEKFSTKIPVKAWERAKEQLASPEALEKAVVAVQSEEKPRSVDSTALKFAKRGLLREALAVRLREVGEIKEGEKYADWLARKLRDARILREDLLPNVAGQKSSGAVSVRPQAPMAPEPSKSAHGQ